MITLHQITRRWIDFYCCLQYISHYSTDLLDNIRTCRSTMQVGTKVIGEPLHFNLQSIKGVIVKITRYHDSEPSTAFRVFMTKYRTHTGLMLSCILNQFFLPVTQTAELILMNSVQYNYIPSLLHGWLSIHSLRSFLYPATGLLEDISCLEINSTYCLYVF